MRKPSLCKWEIIGITIFPHSSAECHKRASECICVRQKYRKRIKQEANRSKVQVLISKTIFISLHNRFLLFHFYAQSSFIHTYLNSITKQAHKFNVVVKSNSEKFYFRRKRKGVRNDGGKIYLMWHFLAQSYPED